MPEISTLAISIAAFAFIALASKELGQFFNRINLPLISGFLFAGVIAGPYVLNLITTEAAESVRFIDEIALAVIAFAAGNELYIKDLRDRLKSITWSTTGQLVFTFTLGTLTIVFFGDSIPFMMNMSIAERAAVAILGGAILVARSPSSAIAIVNELRAKGPFTRTALGVTVIMDVVVIILFGVNSSIADALLSSLPVNMGFIGLIVFELLASLGIGYLLFKALQYILSTNLHQHLKTALVLGLGYSMFLMAGWILETTHEHLSFEVLVEPLLICMIGAFLVSSFSDYRDDFSRIMHQVSPTVYILFFTLTGVSLAFDVLLQTWPIALALFAVRLVGIFIGSLSGGMVARDPVQHNRLGWMAYVTQAGVGLGLAKEVAAEFPDWGNTFSTVIISVIVLNQIVGPPLFKWVVKRVGEAHPRGQATPFDGVRDAMIFGLKAQSVALARQLQRHDWQVKMVTTDRADVEELGASDLDVQVVNELDLENLKQLEITRCDAIVCFLPNDLSYQVCELAYEHFGTETMVVRLRDRSDFERFHKLGVRVVEPKTAVFSLLEHYVRSPVGTSLLLGLDGGQDIIDQEIRNPNLHGLTLREMRLPLDVLVLSIQRQGHTLVSRGFTEFKLGDKVTMVGPQDKLEEVMLRFDA